MTDRQDFDVKRLLGRALGPEPPLTLDRAEVLRAGQRRLRGRRLAASGAVAMTVVAMVFGVIALSGLGGRGEVNQAAPVTTSDSPSQTTTASPTAGDGAPPGPNLPLTTRPIPATSDEHARTLAWVLAKSGVVPPPGLRLLSMPNEGQPQLLVEHASGAYYLSVDLTDGKRPGNLSLEVSYAPGAALPGCPDGSGCERVEESGIPMLATTEKQGPTVIVYLVRAARPDGTRVEVSASNMTKRFMTAEPPARAEPLVDQRMLRLIAALPGLTFS